MDSYVYEIRDTILRLKKPSYSTTNKKEVRVRCPYCGDSKSNPSDAHLYIEMKSPFRFHCFKCETSGVLNATTLRDFEIYDANLPLKILSENNTRKNNLQISKLTFSKVNINNKIENPNLQSLEYFNRRYGTNLTTEYVEDKFKAILNCSEFIKNNRIYVHPSVSFDFYNSIGFLSSDSSHAIIRDTTGTQEIRYYNLNINNVDNASKIYNIKSNINILEDTVNLVITEGIFDIIGVYLNFYKDTPAENNTIFAAACGKGFLSVVNHYIELGFLNLNITIYSDADVNVNFYKRIKNSSVYLKNSRIKIFYNDLYDPVTKFGKDFGVPKSQISLRSVII